ncbi:hypothetical protein [Acanthopleuribacter pedis]|uniref:Uncharacterized protein n=1 Tax=Acanthopleuribacter pedis TaxID=442870 RepID=A0A8J7QDE4_9BACT|nr:hypothetical protein [Acanthopleuribacter pedis]MBO1321300.1 hypothetical protein [Acanthopleuribacter pedis]
MKLKHLFGGCFAVVGLMVAIAALLITMNWDTIKETGGRLVDAVQQVQEISAGLGDKFPVTVDDLQFNLQNGVNQLNLVVIPNETEAPENDPALARLMAEHLANSTLFGENTHHIAITFTRKNEVDGAHSETNTHYQFDTAALRTEPPTADEESSAEKE